MKVALTLTVLISVHLTIWVFPDGHRAKVHPGPRDQKEAVNKAKTTPLMMTRNTPSMALTYAPMTGILKIVWEAEDSRYALANGSLGVSRKGVPGGDGIESAAGPV